MRGEGGFTMVEVLITMGLMSLFMAMAGVSLINMSEASKSTTDRSLTNSSTRQALEAMTRNLRAANPVEVQEPVSLYDTQVSFSVYCQPVGGTCLGSGSSGVRHFTYRVAANVLEVRINNAFEADGVTPRFQRILGPEAQSASSGFPLAQRQYAVVNTPITEPVFSYFRQDRVRLETQGAGAALSSKFRDCSNTLRIRLRVITETGSTSRPIDLSTTINLRNFNQVEGCLST